MTGARGLTLILDSAMPHALVALADDTAVRFERALTVPKRHAEELAPAVADALTEVGADPRDVASVVVGRGPGSFIGVRIALAFAQGFARARGIPARGFSTLIALARTPDLPKGRGLALVDARRGEHYALSVRRGADGAFSVEEAPRALAPAEVSLRTPELAFIVGNGLDALGLVGPLAVVERSGVTAAGARAALASGDPMAAVPDYLRPPDVRLPGAPTG